MFLFNYRRLIYANQKPFDNDADEQKIPVKMREYLELNKKLKEKRQSIKKTLGAKKLKNKEIAFVYDTKPDDKGAETNIRPTPEFKKLQNESEASFLNRIDQV